MPLSEQILWLERQMYLAACGHLTTLELRRAFTRLGWTVDLRHWLGNTLEAFDPSGQWHLLSC